MSRAPQQLVLEFSAAVEIRTSAKIACGASTGLFDKIADDRIERVVRLRALKYVVEKRHAEFTPLV